MDSNAPVHHHRRKKNKNRAAGGRDEKRRRKGRRRKEKRGHGHRKKELEAAALLLFPQVLQPVAESQFLTTKELGRLLLLTQKGLTMSAFEEGPPAGEGDDEQARNNNDAVWKCLCFAEWGISDASVLLQSMKPLSAEQCFRKLVVADDTEQFPGPRSLQYAPEDYVVVIQMREEERQGKAAKHMYSKVIPGQDIADFFEKGEAKIEFEQPLWKKALEEGQDKVKVEWDGTLHIMRRPDQRVIELTCYASRHETLERSTESNGHCEDAVSTWITRVGWVNEIGSYGQTLVDHYSRTDDYYNRICFQFDHDYRMVTNAEGGSTNDAIGIYGLSLRADFEDNVGDHLPVSEVVQGENITFAHFLEAMDVW